MTPEVRAEFAEMRAALAEAQRSQIEVQAAREQEAGLDLTFAHGAELVELELAYSGYFGGNQRGQLRLNYTWDEIFQTLGPFMLDEASESALRATWSAHMLREAKVRDTGIERWGLLESNVADASWGIILVQLRALGLIANSGKNHGVANKAIYWTLTPAGDRYLVNLRGVKSENAPVDSD